MGFIAAQTSTLMLLAGMSLLALILLRRSYRYFGRRNRPNRPDVQTTRPSEHAMHDAPSAAPPEFLRWQVAMHETARDLKAELDSKMGALQHLVRQAAEQSQSLENSIERARQLRQPGMGDTLSRIERATAESGSAATGATWERPFGQLPPTPPAARGELAASPDHLRAVYRLADRGHSLASIADQVGLSVGDIEMMLSLRTPD